MTVTTTPDRTTVKATRAERVALAHTLRGEGRTYRLTPADRARLRRMIDARRRRMLADPRTEGAVDVNGRCLGAATEQQYGRGCRCCDCREVATENRRQRKRRTC